MSTKNAICGWDFTVGCITDENTCVQTYIDKDSLLEWCKQNYKKFCFQLERGEKNGYLHFQGRVSLKVKSRKLLKPVSSFNYSPTCTENVDNDFYVTKKETRIDGPWSDRDIDNYIPRQVREIGKLYPWQQYIVDNAEVWDTRHINILYDPKGCVGKTTIKGYLRAHNLARPIPFCNDFKDILRMVYCMKTSKCYLIDIPKALKKDKLFQMFAAIESVKDGYAYDDRHVFKEKYFDCPNIWVFTNSVPDISYLTDDRWVFWGIDDDKKLFRRTLMDPCLEKESTPKKSRIVKN